MIFSNEAKLKAFVVSNPIHKEWLMQVLKKVMIKLDILEYQERRQNNGKSRNMGTYNKLFS